MKKFFKKAFWFGVAALALVGVGMAIAGTMWEQTIVVKAETNTVVVEAKAPIMDRIADCESGDGKPGTAHQFNADGSVVKHKNTDGSTDYGKYQINSVHLAEAMQMEFNVFKEEGNTGYAKWLYANRGTGDWSSSQKCWSR